jgi:hypothetical protein
MTSARTILRRGGVERAKPSNGYSTVKNHGTVESEYFVLLFNEHINSRSDFDQQTDVIFESSSFVASI